METNFFELKEILGEFAPKFKSSGTFSMKENTKSRVIENAIKAYAPETDINNIIALYDITLTCNGKEGIIFTTAGFYCKETFGKPYYVKYSEIKTIKHEAKGKKDCDGKLIIELINGTTAVVATTFLNKTPFMNYLYRAKYLSQIGRVAETDKILILEDMDDEIKLAYVSCVAAFANVDSEISPVELNRLYMLMVRIKTDSLFRQEIMMRLSEAQVKDSYEEELAMNAPVSSLKVIGVSLVKDIIVMAGKDHSDFSAAQKDYLTNVTERFHISSQEVDIVQGSINLEAKYLKGEIDEKKFVKGMQDLGANAAAIGFPIAAVYLSGSVVGLSAAGITSGLASLGLGGVLGLSSMVTGVGALVLIGVAAHTGVKWVTSHSRNEKVKNKRDYLIAEAMRKNQETISALIEDIGFLSEKIEECMKNIALNEEKIRILAKKIKMWSDAVKPKNTDITVSNI